MPVHRSASYSAPGMRHTSPTIAFLEHAKTAAVRCSLFKGGVEAVVQQAARLAGGHVRDPQLQRLPRRILVPARAAFGSGSSAGAPCAQVAGWLAAAARPAPSGRASGQTNPAQLRAAPAQREGDRLAVRAPRHVVNLRQHGVHAAMSGTCSWQQSRSPGSSGSGRSIQPAAHRRYWPVDLTTQLT